MKLVLNINNSTQSKPALKKLDQVSSSTFRALSIEEPKGHKTALVSGKTFSSDSDSFAVTLNLDKSNIDTWNLTVTSK